MSEGYKDGNDHQLACQDNNGEYENNTQLTAEVSIDEDRRSEKRKYDSEEDKEQFCEETGKVENDTQQGNKGNDVIEEVKKIIDEKFDILNNKLESIESKQEEKLETLNSRLGDIESSQKEKLESLNSRLGDIESSQKEKLESLNSRLGDIESNQKEKLESLNSRLGDIESKFKTQEEYEKKLNDVKSTLQLKESELAATSSNLKNTKEQLQSKKSELDDVKSTLQLKESELATTSSNLETTKIRLNELETKLTTIENYLFKFKPLVRKMEKCSSLSKINSQINSESENERFLKFVGIFGNGEDFLRDLYKEFKDNKMNEKIALTTEELEFIDEINRYFRENILEEGQEEDVLITVDPSQDKFDKSIMQDILKASDFSFKTVEEFYVPGVKTKSYNFKAIVKGRK